MKNESIMLDKIIKMSLIEQTGLVKDPLPSKNKNDGTDDSGFWGWASENNAIFWGGLVLAALFTFGGYKIFRKVLSRLTRKAGVVGADDLSKVSTTQLLKLYRGMSNPQNIAKFKTWVNGRVQIRVKAGSRVEGGKIFNKELNSFESLAKFYKAVPDEPGGDAAKAIFKLNSKTKTDPFYGMTYDQANSKLNIYFYGGIKPGFPEIKIPRGITKSESEQIFKLIDDPRILKEIQDNIFKESFKRFKKGRISADAFIKELPKNVAKKHGPAIRNYANKLNSSTRKGPRTP